MSSPMILPQIERFPQSALLDDGKDAFLIPLSWLVVFCLFADSIYNMEQSGLKIYQYRTLQARLSGTHHARWIYEMVSDGRGFPAKVCPTAFSKCHQARKY